MAAGILVYDQVRADPTAASTVIHSDNGTNIDSIESRLRALESVQAPILQAPDAGDDVMKRLRALENALAARVTTRNESPPQADAATATTTDLAPASSPTVAGRPTASEIRRFRQLQEAVKREERMKHHRSRVTLALDKLGLQLTSKQQEDIAHKLADFRQRSNEIWDQVKVRARATIDAGGTVDKAELMETTTTTLQSEFAASLQGVVPPADAESIAEALMPHRRRK